MQNIASNTYYGKEIQTDFLILGSGISGLSFALKAAEMGKVTIVTKKDKIDTATNLAQGGIAAVLSREDSFELHIRDTLEAGAGLCREEVVRMVVESGPDRIRELIESGVSFSRKGGSDDALDLGREGGHSTRRIAHAKDLTGREIESSLLARAAENTNIDILENHLAVDLLIASRAGLLAGNDPQDRCLGAFVLDRRDNSISSYQAKVTVLCTGGAGKVYLYTTNPDIATGDGIAMAWRAGARVANLEFVQFHPTCLFHPRAKNFLISEAVRGEGGRLIDQKGNPFMQKYDPRGDLATRDQVARAIDRELKASGDDCVYLDITHKDPEYLKKRFPNIYSRCLSLGIDITREPVPVVPAAHYVCGGVMTDIMGRTSIKNLYAFGETAWTGLHGGNRLASNSLLEAVVFAHQAYLQCKKDWPELKNKAFPKVPPWSSGKAERIEECVLISHNWDQIRRLMWNYVGIVRSEKRLNLVQRRMDFIHQEVMDHYHDYLLTPDLIELRNIAILADLIIKCALSRKESRGLHYLIDYPERSSGPARDTVLVRKNGPSSTY